MAKVRRVPLSELQDTERLQAAVVLVASGDESRLESALAMGRLDWRDLLVAAGLASGDWGARLDERL
jgi:hypothetical protein